MDLLWLIFYSLLLRLLYMEGWSIVYTTSCSVVSIHPWLIWACVLINSRAIDLCMEIQRHCWKQHLVLGCHHVTHSCMGLSLGHVSPLYVLSRLSIDFLSHPCYLKPSDQSDLSISLIIGYVSYPCLDLSMSPWGWLWRWSRCSLAVSPLWDVADHHVLCSGLYLFDVWMNIDHHGNTLSLYARRTIICLSLYPR